MKRLAFIALLLCAGCKAMIPDSLNYTYASDFKGDPPTHYLGASWNVPKGQ